MPNPATSAESPRLESRSTRLDTPLAILLAPIALSPDDFLKCRTAARRLQESGVHAVLATPCPIDFDSGDALVFPLSFDAASTLDCLGKLGPADYVVCLNGDGRLMAPGQRSFNVSLEDVTADEIAEATRRALGSRARPCYSRRRVVFALSPKLAPADRSSARALASALDPARFEAVVLESFVPPRLALSSLPARWLGGRPTIGRLRALLRYLDGTGTIVDALADALRPFAEGSAVCVAIGDAAAIAAWHASDLVRVPFVVATAGIATPPLSQPWRLRLAHSASTARLPLARTALADWQLALAAATFSGEDRWI